MRLTRVPQQELTYSDSGVREGKEYEYRVIAVNEGGLSDPSPPTDLQFAKASRGKFYPLNFNSIILTKIMYQAKYKSRIKHHTNRRACIQRL